MAKAVVQPVLSHHANVSLTTHAPIVAFPNWGRDLDGFGKWIASVTYAKEKG
jgi:hypothetical protein